MVECKQVVHSDDTCDPSCKSLAFLDAYLRHLGIRIDDCEVLSVVRRRGSWFTFRHVGDYGGNVYAVGSMEILAQLSDASWQQ